MDLPGILTRGPFYRTRRIATRRGWHKKRYGRAKDFVSLYPYAIYFDNHDCEGRQELIAIPFVAPPRHISPSCLAIILLIFIFCHSQRSGAYTWSCVLPSGWWKYEATRISCILRKYKRCVRMCGNSRGSRNWTANRRRVAARSPSWFSQNWRRIRRSQSLGHTRCG